MEIADIRHATGLSQRGFAERYGIPLGTIRNWEQGVSAPPKYVVGMLEHLVESGGAVIETNSAKPEETSTAEAVEAKPAEVPAKKNNTVGSFTRLLQRLAALTENGYVPLGEDYVGPFNDAVHYDESTAIVHGGAHGGYTEYRVVRAVKVDEEGSRQVLYWGGGTAYDLKLIHIGEDFHLELKLAHDESEQIPTIMLYGGACFFAG